jgi:serine/threonine protein kinase
MTQSCRDTPHGEVPLTAAAASCDIPRGTQLGKHEILRKLATGGMAEIYLACIRGQAGFEKLVVLKRLLPHLATDPPFVQMFLDEARLAATLRHPNIADVYDISDVDGTLFFTMEYIHGQDVRSIRMAARKRNELIPLAISLAIIQGTAAALQCAHQMQGADGRSLELVHRDISANNVVVSYDGAIKLLDFGIARTNDHQHKTQTGTLKGKAPYMSPEQCLGQRLDRRTDLFSLGVVLFELTLGRRPFRGENDFTIMQQIVHGRVPSPSSIVADYPRELEAIVMKLLAHAPGARYATAEELLHDLESFVAKHRLWVSSTSVGKYMRHAFADRVDAWTRASHKGVSLGQYVAETTTSLNHKAALVASSSAFSGLRAAGTPSQELAASSSPISQRLPTAASPASRSAASRIGEPSKAPVVYPEFRSSRRMVVAMLAALLVSGGGIAGFYAWQTQHELTATRGALAPVEPGAPEPSPEPSIKEQPAVPEPSPEPSIKEQPAVPEPSPEPSIKEQPAVTEPRVELRGGDLRSP